MPDIGSARPVAGAPIETLWGQQIHDVLEAVRTIVYGEVSVPLTASVGTASVQFGVTFAVRPTIVVAPTFVVQSLASYSVVSTNAPTTTGCDVTVARPVGAATGNVVVQFMAIGVLA